MILRLVGGSENLLGSPGTGLCRALALGRIPKWVTAALTRWIS